MSPRYIRLDGGTEYGLGYWGIRTGGCALKAQLVQPLITRGGLSGKEALDVGSIVHAYKREWYLSKGQFDSGSVQIRDVPEGIPVVRLAKRVFGAYKRDYTYTRFSVPRLVEVEAQLEPDVWGFPYSYKGDLIVELTAKRLKMLGIDGEPGTWFIDHKVVSGFDMASAQYYQNTLQSMVYPRAHAEATGEKVRGLIFNFLTKEKAPQFALLGCPIRSEHDGIVEAWKARCRESWAKMPSPNPSKCFTWGRGPIPEACEFMGSSCSRGQ